jgi:glycosyltransferase involved in cell wall biosynthesis
MMSRHRPRVLQVALSLSPGGTERLIVALASRLNDDMPMAVCCLDEAGAWAADLEARGIQVTTLGRRPGFHPSLGLSLAAHARAHRADILHAHHYSPFVYSALARLRHPSLKLVFTEHGRLSDRGPSPKRRLANRLLRVAPSAAFAVSEDVKRHLIAEGFGAGQVGVIPNGIDIGPAPTLESRARIRHLLGVSEDTCVIGTIARLDPVKNLGALIDGAAAEISNTSLHVVIVGDGPERGALERRVQARGLTGSVTFLGHREDARDWLAGCDVYANVSVSEGISLTILEAMAAGLPVIATRVGGTPEVVDNTCGRLVDARNIPGLALVVRELAREPARRSALGAAGRARVLSRFTLDRMLEDYRKVFTKLCPGSPSAGAE